ncbi:dynamin family protein [Laribacter hongkongensis]|uniref:dynamin family protein n=1 Tax=Laribacter hongkongensis TaxID=168471 RepID=UPI001EFC6DA5|nr:dynamin family protein [Laribacter hongkongensis]MCG9059800.1 dynamin family protein [Laribacter hongkongensis]MCG9086540.1 dynamin family protein [Laribacter hongkongensis]
MTQQHGVVDRAALLATFARLGQGFEQARQEVIALEGQIDNALQGLNEACDAAVHKGATHPELEAQRAELAGLVHEWLAAARAYHRQTDFRQRMGDSLLAYVYGKVKSGKSSLGNYLAYGISEPTVEQMAAVCPQPGFFWETGNGSTETMDTQRMASQRQFKIGLTETTSSIQGFTLPGLTWVDSPGLGSCLTENGELARAYANAADLVVFASHSNSPGRRSELEELASLLDSEKPMAVLITCSDEIEQDVDEQGNLVNLLKMKSEAARRKQAAYVAQEMAGLKGFEHSNAQVYPVSVRYAETHLDAESWQESGMGEFARALASLADSDGVRIKREAPRKALAAYARTLQGQLLLLQDSLAQYDQGLTSLSGQLQRAAHRESLEACNALSLRIGHLAEQHAQSMDSEGFSNQCRAAVQELADEAIARLYQQAQADGNQLLTGVGRRLADNCQLPAFSRRQAAACYIPQTGKRAGRTLLSLLGAGAAALLASNPISWPALGLGMAGGLVGGKVGEVVGSGFDQEHAVLVDVGDNRDEVASESKVVLERVMADTLEQAVVQLVDMFCTARRQQLDLIRGAANKLEQALADAMLAH